MGGDRLISKEMFAHHVKDSLESYHNPARLQTNPLIELLALRSVPGETRAMSLRQLIRETVESLRPSPSIPASRPEWIHYRLLWLHYVQSQARYAVAQELGLSHTSFYRDRQKALEACASILWEKYEQRNAISVPEEKTPASSSAMERAVEAAVKLARRSRRSSIVLGDVVDTVLPMMVSLAKQQGVNLITDIHPSLPVTYGDETVLRQILINVLTEGIRLAATDALKLVVTKSDRGTVWQLGALDETKAPERNLRQVTGLEVSRALVSGYGGRFWLAGDGRGTHSVCFTLLAAKPKTVLIVDDDQDTIDLYERYMRGQGCVVQAAYSGEQVHALLTENRPNLILLDVLMPKEDGWAILQSLKTMPETAAIPVVICSVLAQPELALSLGAMAVLRKPIGRPELLEVVQAALDRPDSSG